MNDAPIIKVDRWFWRYTNNIVASCRLETFRCSAGHYCVLVTERGDNPGVSVTNGHAELRKAVRSWLQLPEDMLVIWYERYDRDSYIPPRDDLSETSQVFYSPHKNGWHWFHVTEEDWDEIYHTPQRPKPVVKRRKATT